MNTVQTGTLRAPLEQTQEFANEISSRIGDGWTILSSGFDGFSQCWWVIFSKTEVL